MANLPNASTRPRQMVRNKQKKTRSPFDAKKKYHTANFGVLALVIEYLAGKKRNPTFSIAMYMDVDDSFHEVIRLKTHAATCQPRFHAHTRTGAPLEEQIQTINIRWTTQNVAKVTWEKVFPICHWALQTETNLTSENWRTSALPSEQFQDWEILVLQKKIKQTISNFQRKLQFL